MSSTSTTDLDDRTVVLTGGTSGIGRRAALDLADRGAMVAAVGRDEERGREVETAAADAAGDVAFHRADLAEQAAVRELAEELFASYEEIHALANNAGLARGDRIESPDGVELTFAVNHLAPYLLTHELLPRLRESAQSIDGPARVVTTSSGLQYRGELDFDDLQFESGYDGLDAYSRSKLANAVFTVELAERLDAAGMGPDDGGAGSAADGVVANCFSPGFIRGTRIWLGSAWRSRLLTWLVAWVPGVGTDLQTGADRMVDLLAAPEYGERNGVYVDQGEEQSPDYDAQDPAVREQLWDVSADLVGVDPDWPSA
ncbi:SDR family NAD(P)-dependent oxidoreductase [Salinarchaeum sp. Harcht-Bsk1]|uniref:SDR family NAD(P)-dependent oxidoreductase n=1 Tax=Salinarchaeum sp. Harcht-Bsk1 TaxID=1333523 RepID=UPI00191C6D14|nr:SDR family NAD(P)-dependent oxidoreductase [Salinarchaeum sp. Harcht-Bsk1]